MTPILEVKNLVTKFHAIDGIVNAVNGVSFTLEEGETLAIVGESGSGKSVSMMSILGLLPSPPAKVEGGEAIFHSEKGAVDLLKLPYEEMSDMRGGRIGFIFQDPGTSLNPILTVGEQITESLTRHLGMDSQQAKRRAIDLLADVGIPDPELRLRKRMGVSTIWITHDLGLVAGLADRVLVMYAGKIMESAPVDNLYENPQHPYTVGLLGALPRLDTDETRRLVSIEGAPPDSTIPIQHCPFAWRCTRAFDRCWQEIPDLMDVEKNHQAACFAVSGKGG